MDRDRTPLAVLRAPDGCLVVRPRGYLTIAQAIADMHGWCSTPGENVDPAVLRPLLLWLRPE